MGTITKPFSTDITAGLIDMASDLKRRIAGRLKQGPYSRLDSYGLRRDLKKALTKSPAKIPFSVRPLRESDLDILLPENADLPEQEKLQITWRRHFYRNAPANTCWVAVDERDNTPCYMQWLIGAEHNDTLAKFKTFPVMEDNEALMEQAYTKPSHRGLRLMSAAMAEIAERAEDMGARYVMTFVPKDGIASLKGCGRAGFYPHLHHRRIQLGFGLYIHNSFKVIKNDDPLRSKTF